jgi:hypothetical protein
LAVLLKTWKNEGLEGFFRGFGANMISTFSMRESGRQQFLRHAVSNSERLYLGRI